MLHKAVPSSLRIELKCPPSEDPCPSHCITHLISWGALVSTHDHGLCGSCLHEDTGLVFLFIANPRPAPTPGGQRDAARKCAVRNPERPCLPLCRLGPWPVSLEAVVGAWAELGSGPAPSPVASVGSSPMCRGWGSGAILSLPISSKVQLWRLKIPSTWGWMHQKMSSVLPPRSSSHPFQCDCSSSHPEMGSVPCPWIWAGQDLLWPLG